jgi:hypothetical protein
MSDSGKGRHWVAGVLVAYVIGVAAAAVIGSVWAWRTAERRAAVFDVSLLGWHFTMTKEASVFLLVLAFALLGSTVHSASSLASYLGNRRFAVSWTAWYVLRPIIGMALALLAYVVFRGGFLSTQATATDVNLFGVAAISGLAGLFSKQVTDKLEEVMKVVFASKADAARQDKLGDPSLTSLDPDAVTVGAVATITVHGAGFADGAVVLVDEAERPASDITETTLTFTLDTVDVATAGERAIVVKVGNATSGPLTLKVS